MSAENDGLSRSERSVESLRPEPKRFSVSRFSHVITVQMNIPFCVELFKLIRSVETVDNSVYALTDKFSNELFRMGKIHLIDKKETQEDDSISGSQDTNSEDGGSVDGQ